MNYIAEAALGQGSGFLLLAQAAVGLVGLACRDFARTLGEELYGFPGIGGLAGGLGSDLFERCLLWRSGRSPSFSEHIRGSLFALSSRR